MVSKPIKDRKRKGLTRLRNAVRYIALRRDKAAAGLDMVLPAKTERDVLVDFSDGDHKEVYDCLFQLAEAGLEGVVNGKHRQEAADLDDETVTPNRGTALFAATCRVRRACSSIALVPPAICQRAALAFESIKKEDGSLQKLSSQQGNEILTSFFADSEGDKEFETQEFPPSGKIFALLNKIQLMAPDEKGVIFSQWTDHLNLIEKALLQAGYKVARIDGSTRIDDRTEAIKALQERPEVRLLLCTFGAAGEGINLPRANCVFIMDPWWNLVSGTC